MAADEMRGPLVEFLIYCNEERERCRNSGEEFDEAGELTDEKHKVPIEKLAEKLVHTLKRVKGG